MIYLLLADAVVMLHVFFVLFAVLGGLLVLYRQRWLWLHLPAVVWAVLVELTGWICPLTPLENHWRTKGGALPYDSDFIDRYLVPILYPQALTRRHQVMLGLFVILINLAVYAWIFHRHRRRSPSYGP